MLYWPISAKTKMQQTSSQGGRFLRRGRGQLRETRNTSAAPPDISRSTFPRQHRPKDLLPWRYIHLIEVKFCEDNKPQNQLSAAQKQHKGLCSTIQGPSVTLSPHHPIGSEWHHLQQSHAGAFIGSGSWLKELKNRFQASCSFCQLRCQFVQARHALSSNVINSHQVMVSCQAYNPPDPHTPFLFPLVE